MAGGRMWCLAGGVCIIAGGLCLANSAAHGGALSPSDQPWGLLARIQGADFVDLPPARAFPAIDEFRMGVLEPVDGPAEDKDRSPDINLELLLGRFGPHYQSTFWNHLLRPRLHFGGSISTDGGTSLAYIAASRGMSSSRSDFLSKAPLAALFTMVATRSSAARSISGNRAPSALCLRSVGNSWPPLTICPTPISAMKIAG